MSYEDLLLSFPRRRRYATPGVGLMGAEELARACACLGRGWSAGATAIELGYSQGSAFSLAFQRETGESPGAWKKARGIKTRRASSPHLVPRQTWSASDRRKARKRKKPKKRATGPKQDVI